MTSIGDRLREERLRRGLKIDQIAEQTKINPALLEAIETEHFERLPGGFLTRSFVRQYARALGVAENEIEPELSRLSAPEAAAPPASEAAFRPEVEPATVTALRLQRMSTKQSLGALLAFLLILAACSAIYVLWERTRDRGDEDFQPAARVIEAPKPEPAKPSPSTDEPHEAAPAVAEQTAAVAPPPVPPAGIHIDVRARDDAWVRVVADGKVVWEGVIPEGEARSFQGRAAVSLRTGNAGVLEVTWNGKPAGALGPVGQVGIVEFTPEAIQIRPAAPPARRPPPDVL